MEFQTQLANPIFSSLKDLTQATQNEYPYEYGS
jgi:hypothetical protein